MNFKTGLILFILIFTNMSIFAAVEEYTSDQNNDGKPDQWFKMENGVILRIDTDRNYDGIIDNSLVYNNEGIMEYEEMDYNYDGEMDDFYYYEDGILTRREIDSNYDTEIDIWVLLDEGRFVKRLERDLDFDGVLDVIKVY